MSPRRCASVTSKAGPVTAGMIEADPAITIINKDLVLATLTEDVPFEMTLRRSARAAATSPPPRTSSATSEEQEIGLIAVDSIYSPGHPRPLRDRGHPRRPEDQLRPPDPGDLDQRHDHARDGAGRGRQDPPQAPQPVRAVLRAGLRDRQRRRPAATCETAPADARSRAAAEAEHDRSRSWICRSGPTTAWSRPRSRPSATWSRRPRPTC